MTIILEQHAIPKTGTFEIRQTITIRISAEDARRKVNRWVLDEVSCVMGAEEPTLVVDEQTFWHVPVILTASHIGHVGIAGIVAVDVETGEIDDSPECKAAILEGARELATKMPPYTPHSPEDVSAQYIAKDIKPTRTQPQGNPVEIIEAARQG